MCVVRSRDYVHPACILSWKSFSGSPVCLQRYCTRPVQPQDGYPSRNVCAPPAKVCQGEMGVFADVELGIWGLRYCSVVF